jgi:hypothetical protein
MSSARSAASAVRVRAADCTRSLAARSWAVDCLIASLFSPTTVFRLSRPK